jgi:DSF synthase
MNSHLTLVHNDNHTIATMHSKPIPCVTTELLCGGEEMLRYLVDQHAEEKRTIIMSSDVAGYFSLGGDLNLFSTCVVDGSASAKLKLTNYAVSCANFIDRMHKGVVGRFHTIAAVNGNALGGGFELALSCQWLVATKNAVFGLPEIHHGIAPGMGGYKLLANRIAPRLAERIVLSGASYTGQQLYDMGIVDLLVDDDPVGAAQELSTKLNTIPYQYQLSLRDVIPREGFINPVLRWVDDMMRLPSESVDKISRMAKIQTRLFNTGEKNASS